MNLKRIIQEEINDFDWVREIPLIPKEPTVGFEFTLEGDDHSVVYRIDSVDYSTFTVSWGGEMQSDRHVSNEYHVDYYQWYRDDKIIPVDTDMDGKIDTITESEDFDWIGTTEDSPFEELKSELYNKYPEIQIKEDLGIGLSPTQKSYSGREYGTLRITNAILDEGDGVIRETGFAFRIDRVIETIPNKIIYNIGDYDELWVTNNLGEKNELVDSDLSFWAEGNVEEIMKYLHKSSLGRDGSPYIDY